MEREKNTIWFPAKRYGWGWGPPNTWQGWLVMAIYAVLLAAGAGYFLRSDRTLWFVIFAFLLTIVLMVVAWLKGEKPRWRSGRDK